MGVDSNAIESAQIVLPGANLSETISYFTRELGFRVDAIFPADHPSTAVLSGHGVCVRLEGGSSGDPGVLRLLTKVDNGTNDESIAPNGTRIVFVPADPPIVRPAGEQSLVITRAADDPRTGVGRAGMHYRDLIPNRQGGRYVASHITIIEGGPVPDYVHYHKVALQMIYCHRGWVKVVYEDQGEPFVMHAGDCVLQAPRIRHRVLESSAAMQVIEISSPAEHETLADHSLELPTADLRPDRDFYGQRFVRHIANQAEWRPWHLSGFEWRDTGIAAATGGAASAHVVRPGSSPSAERTSHDDHFRFMFVLGGSMALQRDDVADERLAADDSCVIPAGMRYGFASTSPDLELLIVTN